MIKSSVFTVEDFSGGLNTKTATMQIGVNESPNCLNCHSNLFKSLQWRQGSQFLNPTALTDLNGNGATLYPYWVSGVHKEQLVAFFDDKFYRMDDLNGSFTNVAFASTQANDSFSSTIYSVTTKNYLITANYQLSPLQVYDGNSIANLNTTVLTGARSVIAWKRHLWCAFTKESGIEYPYRVRRTDIGTYGANATDWTDGVSGYDDVVTNDGDYNIGYATLRGFLYLFKRYSIFRISYLGGQPLVEIRQVSSIGTESPQSIANVTLLNGDEILIFYGSDNRIYIFNGSNAPQPISELISEDNGFSLFSLPKLNKDRARRFVGVDYPRKHWYVLFTTFGNGATTNNGGYIIDYYTTPFSIFPFDGWHGSGAAIATDSNGARNLYFQGYDGRMRQANYGNDDCGSSINSYYETSRFRVDKVPVIKKAQQAQPLFKTTGNYYVDFGYRINFKAGYKITPISLASSGFILGSSILGTDTLGGVESTIGVIDIPRLFNFIQFSLSKNSTDPRINIYSIDMLATSEGLAKSGA